MSKNSKKVKKTREFSVKNKTVGSPKKGSSRKRRIALPTRNPIKLGLIAVKKVGSFFKNIWRGLVRRIKGFMQRRPHRSFRMTRRRDYVRSFRLPGYFSFTIEVTKLVWKNKVTFLLMGIAYMLLIALFGAMGSQEVFGQLRNLMENSAPESLLSGFSGEVGKAGLLLFTSLTTGLTGNLEPLQIVIVSFLSLYMWLTIVWLLRRMVANKKVKLRDGLYNAGSPILPTFLIVVVFLVQLVPAAIAIIVAGAAWQSGIVSGGAESMAVAIGLLLVVVASLYWVTSTFIALIVITLPGVYPMQALAISGDLVVGRRLRVLYRLIWMIVVVLSWWVVLMIPIILFDGWIKSVFEQIEWLPIVPIALLMLSTASTVWVCTYTYLLYRKMVDDDTSPA